VYRRQNDRAAVEKLGPVADLPDDTLWPDPYVMEVHALQVGMMVRLNRAVGRMREQPHEGIALLRQIAADYPKAERPWLDLGRALNEVKEYSPAEQALDRAVALAPESVEIWFQLGVARFCQANYRAAADAFGKAVHLKPTYGLAHYNLGHCRNQLGDRAGARAAFRAALRYRPDYAAAQKELDQLRPSGPKESEDKPRP
jgi:tetratricopeptide (TPR) repeat protein